MATPRAIGSCGSLRGSLVDLGGAGGLGFLGAFAIALSQLVIDFAKDLGEVRN